MDRSCGGGCGGCGWGECLCGEACDAGDDVGGKWRYSPARISSSVHRGGFCFLRTERNHNQIRRNLAMHWRNSERMCTKI